ncbi:hypothetical protein DPMN_142268 [Dreissena polymorpha]|uniref:Uncharacterized protein n=1 Tax=Dreissena polymorpha TaxID=45954 RepID=A0A9D4JKM8_DREPO|nr:hypothetical protein DPMN_142268 [Dreissena polymorpha]
MLMPVLLTMTYSKDRQMYQLSIPAPNMKNAESNPSRGTSTRHSLKLRFMCIQPYQMAAQRELVFLTVYLQLQIMIMK